jgi:hypothetical protein
VLLGVKRESTDINIFEQKLMHKFFFSLFRKVRHKINTTTHTIYYSLSLLLVYNFNKEERREIIKR